jgi:hypothetical protein
MKNFKLLACLFVFIMAFTSCGEQKNPEDEAKLKEAGEMHDIALAAGEEVSQLFGNSSELMANLQTAIEGADETMKEELMAHMNSLTDAKNDYQLWKESLVEVPGHAHDHEAHSGEGHAHDHSMDDAAPADVLAKQTELKEYIEDIRNRLTKAMEVIEVAISEVEIEG